MQVSVSFEIHFLTERILFFSRSNLKIGIFDIFFHLNFHKIILIQSTSRQINWRKTCFLNILSIWNANNFILDGYTTTRLYRKVQRWNLVDLKWADIMMASTPALLRTFMAVKLCRFVKVTITRFCWKNDTFPILMM